MREVIGEINEDSLKKLDEQLIAAGIDTSVWGKGATKTVANLQKEIEDGETILVVNNEGILIRKIILGAVDVLYTTSEGIKYRLREDRQVFKNGEGRRRDLGHAISGKIKNGENPRDATVREIKEELGGIEGELPLKEISIDDEELLTSPSYPGLRTQYIIHKYDIILGADQFKLDGYVEVEERTGITTYFVWEKII